MKDERSKDYIKNLIALKNTQKEIQYDLRKIERHQRKFKDDCQQSQNQFCKRILQKEHNIKMLKQDAADRQLQAQRRKNCVSHHNLLRQSWLN